MEKRTFNILVLLILFSSALFSIITPMAKELTIYLKLNSEDQVIFINSIFLIVGALSSFVWAVLGDKFSRKPLMIISTLEWSLFTFLTIFSSDFYSLLLFQIFSAIGFGAALPLTFSLTIDLVKPLDLGTKFGILSAFYVLGNGLGQILSGFLIDYYPWQVPILMVSISGFICVMLLISIQEPYRGNKEYSNKKLKIDVKDINYSFKLKDLKKIWEIKTTFWILCLNFIMFIGIGAISSFFISMLKNDFSYNSITSTLLLIIVFGCQIPGGLLFGKIGDKKYSYNKKGRITIALICLLVGSIMYIVGFSLVVFSREIFMFIIFFLFIIIGAFLIGGIDPLMQATLGEINPPQIRSTVFSINYLLTVSLGRSISLLLLGHFFNTFNNQYIPGYLILSFIAFSCIIFFLPIFKHLFDDMRRIKKEIIGS